MDTLSKTQKDEYATAFAILALYDGGADVTADQITALLEATGNTEVEAFYPLLFASFLNSPKKIAELIAMPSAGNGSTVGGGGEAESAPDNGKAPVEVKDKDNDKEEPVDEPVGFDGGIDMFGGDDGDY